MNCTTPIQLGDKLLICSSAKGDTGGVGLLAVPNTDSPGLGASLKADSVNLVWVNRQVGPMHNDPVLIDGCLYAYSGFSRDPKGFVCLDLANGQQKWFTDQLGGPGTVVQVAGDLLCLSNRGRLALIRPSPEGPKKLSEFQAIEGYPVWTEPIIAGGRLYVRFASQLVCYELAR